MSETTWQPILAGASAARAREVIAAIAADLAEMSPAAEAEADDQESPAFSLAAGDAGQALFFAYLDLALPGSGWEEAALARLERAIEAAGAIETFPGLYSGFTGVAWVLEHFQAPMFGDPGPGDAAPEYDPGAEIASALVPYLAQSVTPQDYDLISGLAGVGTYALERLPRSFGRECLEHLAARLEETAEERPEGFSWHTPPALILEKDRATYPRGYYNLGVAHGVPGVIGLLAGMCAAGVAAAPARRLLDGAVAWLLAQNQGPAAESCFSYHAGPDSTFTSTRLAWCYGDLGVAVTLLASARAVGHGGWEREALAIGRAAAARAPRPEEIARSADYGLCHGAAGVGHLFNRLYQASGDPCFRTAATIWFERALAAAQPGAGVGGYLALLSDGDDQLAWRPDPGFLTGAAGIGLALLATTEAVEPAWDRVLLASLPPRRDLPR
jgi:lantibiotic modifying enzyme